MVRVDFSDPQGGKGAADRLAATCKGHIRAFINEGHDVCTAADVRNALLSHGGLERVRVVSLKAVTETPDDSPSITGITKLNNFRFSSNDSITCWRAYCIGRGKTIKPEKPSSGKYAHCILKLAQHIGTDRLGSTLGSAMVSVRLIDLISRVFV